MRISTLWHIAIVLSVAAPAAAEEVANEQKISVELNTAQTTDTACRLSFLIQNDHAADIDRAAYEAVLFNAEGGVQQLTLLDFGALPAGRARVRQFEFAGMACSGLSSILINGASTCEAEGLGADVCATTLELSSRTEIGLLG
ncbi:hypothetical protein [Loktanella sp. S4079]|uniref:hypothetical protein n=1 Tax=Loktanella sp. S4079 TaxID=579483 RepID=UPI0005F9FF98|nr:hypothetical protein [Loktanella sp. S4079]KJZ19319.1 hypothetical protein TW80_11105 [Loktanella sp. S4079]